MTPLRLKLGDVLWQHLFRPYLFGKDAEDAHIFTVRALERMQQLNLLWALKLLYRSPHYRQPVKVFGVPWRNPVGLAAGFDKQGEVIPALEALGFGSAEIGTVTPRPQPGNDRPRLFRYPALGAVINRYGFNSEGAEAVANRLMAPGTFRARFKLPIGISIGKNKDTPDAKAVKDYLAAFDAILWALRPGADWVKINISSPNTPQLRDIFQRLDEFLEEFTEGARHIANIEHDRPLPPFVLKVPPDGLSAGDMERLVKVAARYGFAGIEAVNTTTSEAVKRSYGLTDWNGTPITGGVSGEPLRQLSTLTVHTMAKPCREAGLDLVGVGGISRSEDALEKREAGALAVQVYTGLVFRGPLLIHEILAGW